ncbi:MAG TPA: LysR substrate-binding domain-containing protein [Steroidobacteraceae bacterium]|nr:LysR substrate-binding domain-containing protein [Steroidobacteraceae bacterium]
MKLQQLRYLVAVHENGLNITAAARELHTSQPGVSRQLKMLEEELGFRLFEREGRALTRITSAGEEIIARASNILREMHNIRRTSQELRKADGGTLSIATTHTQARYVLPPVIRAFREKYPKVRLHLHQGTSEQIAELIARDRVDFAIATGSDELFPHLVRLPVYRWHRTVVVPHGHPLAAAGKLTLQKLAQHPIVTYVFSFSGRSSLPAMFEAAGLSLDVALTARDADVIKTYVRIGLGVGIVASVALDPANDADLAVLDAKHLFDEHTSWLGFRRGTLLRAYMYEFIEQLAPHLPRRLVRDAERSPTQDEIDRLMLKVPIPSRDAS